MVTHCSTSSCGRHSALRRHEWPQQTMVAMAPPRRRVLTLLVDNYDSYTYNVFQMLAEVNGVAPVVIKNDDYDSDWSQAWAEFQEQAQRIKADFEAASGPVELAFNVVISPGPGHPAEPQDFGMCAEAIRATASTGVPLLGVCLGHQGIAHVFGGRVINAPEVMHGRTSAIQLENDAGGALFAHIPSGFHVVRYHSLVVDPTTVPKNLRVTARTQDGVIMALEHVDMPQFGVQFHPEAVCSEYGYQLFHNFRDVTLGEAPSKCALQHGDRSPYIAASVVTTPAPEPEYQVLIERVATGLASLDFAEHVFQELFGASSRSFWLDSSNFTHCDQASESNDPQADVRGRQPSRFSLMGDGTGPLSHCIEFSVLHRRLRTEHADGHVDSSDNADVMAILRDKLSQFGAHRTAYNGEGTVPFNFRGGYVGYLGYELLQNGLDDERDSSASVLRENLLAKAAKGEYVPDASLLFADRVLVFDHQASCIYTLSVTPNVTTEVDASSTWHTTTASTLLALVHRFRSHDHQTESTPGAVSSGTVTFHPSRSRNQYLADIDHVQREIHAGETYEVCLTNQLRAATSIRNPLAFYSVLRKRNPAPYAAFYQSNPDRHFHHHHRVTSSPTPPSDDGMMERTYAVCCSSPERFLRVEADGWMESKPIKGTRRRGRDANEDDAIVNELAHCTKDRAENMMIADLVRNDFGRVAQIGSVHVPQLMKVESYATVHQLVTTVRAKRSVQADVVDVVHATFPGGSMTGAPKKRTMQLIRGLERQPRGVYSGALGFFSIDGSCDLNIVIRTAVVTKASVSLGSGGAIVALSECDDEYDEMLLKTNALVQAIGAFVTGRDDGTGATVVASTMEEEEA